MPPADLISSLVKLLVVVTTERHGELLLGEDFKEVPGAEPPHVIDEVVRRLTPLDRYERRALSRRKQAIREFDSTKRQLERESNVTIGLERQIIRRISI